MDTTDLDFDHIEQHNAQYAREVQLAKEVSRLLKSQKFPDNRIWVDLRFDYSMPDHSASSVELINISGEVHGVAVLRFQGLFLYQDFKAMFEEVVPHEVAHILQEIKAKENNTVISKPHEQDWQDMVEDLSPEATPSAKVKGQFDDRAIKLLKGGIATTCECGDDEAFAVFADTPGVSAKLHEEELTCTTCKFAYVRTNDRSKWPEKVLRDMKFLEGVKAVKLHHAQLQR
jgi:predicted SprT family Zn-dependent metalloprotease